MEHRSENPRRRARRNLRGSRRPFTPVAGFNIGSYTVRFGRGPMYIVDLTDNYCTCRSAKGGRTCKHLYAVRAMVHGQPVIRRVKP